MIHNKFTGCANIFFNRVKKGILQVGTSHISNHLSVKKHSLQTVNI